MLHGVYDREVADVFTLGKESAGMDAICTRGHSLKLLNKKLPNRTLHQHSFGHRIVPIWNDLPEVVTAPTLNT